MYNIVLQVSREYEIRIFDFVVFSLYGCMVYWVLYCIEYISIVKSRYQRGLSLQVADNVVLLHVAGNRQCVVAVELKNIIFLGNYSMCFLLNVQQHN